MEIPGAVCAAKKIHDIFQDRSEIPAADIQRATAKFVEECQLMSTLRHQHIVQFLGVCFLPGPRLPQLVNSAAMASILDLADVISARTSMLERIRWFQRKGLLAQSKNCPSCSSPMDLQKRTDVSDEYRYWIQVFTIHKTLTTILHHCPSDFRRPGGGVQPPLAGNQWG